MVAGLNCKVEKVVIVLACHETWTWQRASVDEIMDMTEGKRRRARPRLQLSNCIPYKSNLNSWKICGQTKKAAINIHF